MAEDVISGEGSKNPGAACNQLSGLLHGVQKRRKEKKRKKYEASGRLESSKAQHSVLAWIFPHSCFTAGSVI